MNVVIIGAGGHGRVVLDILRAAGVHEVLGFLDADPQVKGESIHGAEVLGGINMLGKLKAGKVRGAIIAIGDNSVRRSYAKKVADQGLELVNAVHPSAVVSATARLGRNVVVAAGSIICTDAYIQDSVIVNTAAIVDHECIVAPGTHICPKAALAGRVRVGQDVFIGISATVIQCLSIGDRTIVGAGAVVIEDVPAGATVVGVPARLIKMEQQSSLAAASASGVR